MSTDPLHLPPDEYAEWFARLPEEDAADFCDLAVAVPLRWVDGAGWVESPAPTPAPGA